MSTVILRTAVKLIVPLSLVFAMYIYFKGHQTPGGGFVAGLVAAVALIVQRMSHGHSTGIRRLPRPSTKAAIRPARHPVRSHFLQHLFSS